MDSKATTSKRQLLNSMYPAPQRIPKSNSNSHNGTLSHDSSEFVNDTSPGILDPARVNPTPRSNGSVRLTPTSHEKNRSAGSCSVNEREANAYLTHKLPAPASPPQSDIALPQLQEDIKSMEGEKKKVEGVEIGRQDDEDRSQLAAQEMQFAPLEEPTADSHPNGADDLKKTYVSHGTNKKQFEKDGIKQNGGSSKGSLKKSRMVYATKCICIVSHYGFFTQVCVHVVIMKSVLM